MLDTQTASRIGPEGDIKRLDSFAQTDIAQSHVWRQEEPVGRYVLALTPNVLATRLMRRVRMADGARRRLKQTVEQGRALVATGARVAHGSPWAVAAAVVALIVAAPLVSMMLPRS